MFNVTRDILNLKVINAVSGEIVARKCTILVNRTDLSFCALAVAKNLGKSSKNLYYTLSDIINVNTASVVCVYNEKNPVDKTTASSAIPLFDLEICDENKVTQGDVISAEFEKQTGKLVRLCVKKGENNAVIPANRITNIYADAKKLLVTSISADRIKGDGRMEDMQSKINELSEQLQRMNALVNKLSAGNISAQATIPVDNSERNLPDSLEVNERKENIAFTQTQEELKQSENSIQSEEASQLEKLLESEEAAQMRESGQSLESSQTEETLVQLQNQTVSVLNPESDQTPIMTLVKEKEQQSSSGDLFVTPETHSFDEPNIANFFSTQQTNIPYVSHDTETKEDLLQDLGPVENEGTKSIPQSSVNQILSEMNIGMTDSMQLTSSATDSVFVQPETPPTMESTLSSQQLSDTVPSQDSSQMIEESLVQQPVFDSMQAQDDILPMMESTSFQQPSFEPTPEQPEPVPASETVSLTQESFDSESGRSGVLLTQPASIEPVSIEPTSLEPLQTETPLSPAFSAMAASDDDEPKSLTEQPSLISATSDMTPLKATSQPSSPYSSEPMDTESVKKAAAEILAQMPSVTAQKKAKAAKQASKEKSRNGSFEVSETVVKGVAMVVFLVLSFILRKNGVF